MRHKPQTPAALAAADLAEAVARAIPRTLACIAADDKAGRLLFPVAIRLRTAPGSLLGDAVPHLQWLAKAPRTLTWALESPSKRQAEQPRSTRRP